MCSSPRLRCFLYQSTVFDCLATVVTPFIIRLLTVFHRFYRFLKNGRDVNHARRVCALHRVEDNGGSTKGQSATCLKSAHARVVGASFSEVSTRAWAY
jgi:hypothetical protein